MPGGLTPEQKARVEIDALLEAAGWKVQDKEELNLSAGRGIAVREFHVKGGFADYLLYGDKKVLGTIEAKKVGELLLGVETQSDDYAEGFTKSAAKKGIPYWSLPLPFHYESTGKQTNFANRLDPNHAPRRTFAFHRPETLMEVVKSGETLRQKLQHPPPLNPEGLRKNQIRAIPAIEDSFKRNRLKTLTPQIMGSGKTILAAAEAARLLQYAKPEGQTTMRILFLVDRRNLGRQAYDEFNNYVVPGDGRKFGELFNVQRLTSQHISPSANVVISTIQRLYAILRDEEDFDEEQEDESVFEQGGDDFTPLEVVYNASVPIELFDFIFADEAHRSIYGRWGQVLDYFDSFLVGLTATPSKFTYGYFDGNVVAPYTYEESLIDQINVDYTTYRIKTEVTGKGSSIGKGEYVVVRSKATKEEAYKELEDDITYDQTKLDRAVVSKDQIRTIITTFRDKVCTEIFPGRAEVPKTVVFCKHEQHAEDVLQIVRDEFGRGSDFARKITYKTHGSTNQLIQDFRTDPKYRVAVTVDQIATGTDIKPVECLLFLRMVQSRSYFEQMKGRGVRKIDPDDFWAVTPGAKEQGATKDHFVVVDCVGLTDEDKAWVDTRPLDRKPQATLAELLDQVAKGSTDDDLLATVASRLVRLESRLDHDQEQEVLKAAGVSIKKMAEALIRPTDPDQVKQAAAGAIDEDREPSEDEIKATRQELADSAVTSLHDPKVRETLLTLLTQTEQIIDLTTQDTVIEAGFGDKEAKSMTETFEQWIKDHHDEYVALRAYFSTPYKDRPTLKDLKDLAAALEAPPLFLTPNRLWRAYEQINSDKVKGQGKVAADLVSLIRFAVGKEDELTPHADAVKLRFDIWLSEQEQNGKKFNATQRGWLMMVRDHVATSLSIEPEDFDLDPFSQDGGLVAAHEVFGDDLDHLLDELNQELTA